MSHKIIQAGNSLASLPDNLCPFVSNIVLAPVPNSTIQQPGTMSLAPMLLPVVCMREKCALWVSRGEEGNCAVNVILHDLAHMSYEAGE